jgi:hypothetical protein
MLNSFCVECMEQRHVSSSSLMLMHGTKYQQCSGFVLGFGVVKLLITLNSSKWLRAHLVPNPISTVHQASTNVCNPLIGGYIPY